MPKSRNSTRIKVKSAEKQENPDEGQPDMRTSKTTSGGGGKAERGPKIMPPSPYLSARPTTLPKLPNKNPPKFLFPDPPTPIESYAPPQPEPQSQTPRRNFHVAPLQWLEMGAPKKNTTSTTKPKKAAAVRAAATVRTPAVQQTSPNTAPTGSQTPSPATATAGDRVPSNTTRTAGDGATSTTMETTRDRANSIATPTEDDRASSIAKPAEGDRATPNTLPTEIDRATSNATATEDDRASSIAKPAEGERATSNTLPTEIDRATSNATAAEDDRASSIAKPAEGDRATSNTLPIEIDRATSNATATEDDRATSDTLPTEGVRATITPNATAGDGLSIFAASCPRGGKPPLGTLAGDGAPSKSTATASDRDPSTPTPTAGDKGPSTSTETAGDRATAVVISPADEQTTPASKSLKGKGCRMDSCYNKTKKVSADLFTKHGEFVGSHPIPFIVLPILILGFLGGGLYFLDQDSDLEQNYYPLDSQAIKNRQSVRDVFPNLNNVSYNAFSQSDSEQALTLIFVLRSAGPLSASAVSEIQSVVDRVKALTATDGSQVPAFTDVCAKFNSACVVNGEFALTPSFVAALSSGTVSYPYWNGLDLRSSIAGVQTSGQILTSVRAIKISFKLAKYTPTWDTLFQEFAANITTTFTEVAYGFSSSLGEELDKSTKGDILFFSLTITLCCTYASVVTSGGNPVSSRGALAFGGILSVGLSILGSMGLLSACGVKFVNIVGVIPFLIIGIGIDDMFLIMSSWSDSLPSEEHDKTVEHVPKLLGKTLASAGIGITITSLTDFLAFVIGTTSVFRSVTNFSLYAGVAVLFSYMAIITIFSGCVVLHGRRVYSSRHTFTCRKTKPRQQLEAEGRSRCFALFCGGAPPQGPRADESWAEKLPRFFLPKIFTRKPVCVMIILAFLGYLAVSIYGLVNLPQGLLLKNLVSDDSYYHSYLTKDDTYFPTTLPIGYIVDAKIGYSAAQRQQFLNLLATARLDSRIDSNFERCWLSSYLNSTIYDSSAPQSFVPNLQTFLANNPDFAADVVLDSSQTEILASRCFVMSEPSHDQYAMAGLMQDLRGLADDSPLSVFAYHSAFVAYEQFIAVLPATLQMVGCAVAIMTVVTFLLLPHLLMVFLVVLTILMILSGIFGFLYFWDLTLSSVTMIHLVMSVGFSVDFSAHVCAAYLMSDRVTRQERVADAMTHAGGPIMNGAFSTLLGVVLLAFSSSYVFFSFFKIMVMVLSFGLLHAILFLPAVLSLVGPENRSHQNDGNSQEHNSRDSMDVATQTQLNQIEPILSPQKVTTHTQTQYNWFAVGRLASVATQTQCSPSDPIQFVLSELETTVSQEGPSRDPMGVATQTQCSHPDPIL